MQVPPNSPAPTGGSLSLVISVLGILVAGAVALIVAYLHRKQMRQIEVCRQNPALGLVPPPHSVIAFLRAHKYLVLISGGGLILVILGFLQPGPITRLGVLTIALGASGIMSGFLFDLDDKVVRVLEKRSGVTSEDKKPT